jgi:hypothetical protein
LSTDGSSAHVGELKEAGLGQLGYHSMRPGGYSDAITSGMPNMLAAFIGGWSMGTAQQFYFRAGDEIVTTIQKYLKYQHFTTHTHTTWTAPGRRVGIWPAG